MCVSIKNESGVVVFSTSFLFVHSNNFQKAGPVGASITPTKSGAPSFSTTFFPADDFNKPFLHSFVFHSFSSLVLISVSFPYFLLVSMQIRFLSVFFCWDFRLVPVLFTLKRENQSLSFYDCLILKYIWVKLSQTLSSLVGRRVSCLHENGEKKWKIQRPLAERETEDRQRLKI